MCTLRALVYTELCSLYRNNTTLNLVDKNAINDRISSVTQAN